MLIIKDPAESEVVEFSFTGKLPAITSATVTVSVTGDGIDPDVLTVLQGAVTIVGTTVYQRIDNGVSGVVYQLRCEASWTTLLAVETKTLLVKTRTY